MSGFVLWDAFFGGNATRITKALYGSFLVRDYGDAATAVAAYSPFDPETGNLSPTLLTTDGWRDVGLLSEQGVSFAPQFQTVDTMVWQSRQAQRTDVTQDAEECSIQCAEASPVVDALRENLPLQGLPAMGAIGYTVTKPKVPQMVYRQVLALGVDGSSGHNEYFGVLFPRSLMIKPDKVDWQAKTEILTPLTFGSYPDPYSGFSVRRFREGPAWRASGGTTTAPGTPVAVAVAGAKATLTFAPPTSPNGPFLYRANKIVAGVTTPVPPANVTVNSTSPSAVVLTVTGLTVGDASTFTVQATGANGSQSVPSTASNSITVLA
ncbi:hypothetical protein F5X71_34600 [Nocardia brasiliensis]|uniref:Fibronectin type-III domain-containing protein n=1 Tax=Nocardia brasiliensis TaxID=37326 RepID=A0A6G9Y108_NOCBR|nr:hypothetical protein [Nocardia brasiliensis]QIS06757.1 hypothetical protein F5X71_34600 [Nocardia brasiliensis]